MLPQWIRHPRWFAVAYLLLPAEIRALGEGVMRLVLFNPQLPEYLDQVPGCAVPLAGTCSLDGKLLRGVGQLSPYILPLPTSSYLSPSSLFGWRRGGK